jgi:hypothetical protein
MSPPLTGEAPMTLCWRALRKLATSSSVARSVSCVTFFVEISPGYTEGLGPSLAPGGTTIATQTHLLACGLS